MKKRKVFLILLFIFILIPISSVYFLLSLYKLFDLNNIKKINKNGIVLTVENNCNYNINKINLYIKHKNNYIELPTVFNIKNNNKIILHNNINLKNYKGKKSLGIKIYFDNNKTDIFIKNSNFIFLRYILNIKIYEKSQNKIFIKSTLKNNFITLENKKHILQIFNN